MKPNTEDPLFSGTPNLLQKRICLRSTMSYTSCVPSTLLEKDANPDPAAAKNWMQTKQTRSSGENPTSTERQGGLRCLQADDVQEEDEVWIWAVESLKLYLRWQQWNQREVGLIRVHDQKTWSLSLPWPGSLAVTVRSFLSWLHHDRHSHSDGHSCNYLACRMLVHVSLQC